jgi:hypothetical protein
MILSPEQLFIIGIVASVIVQALRLLSEYVGFTPNRLVITVALMLVSGGLGFVFFGAPELGADPVAGFVNVAVSIAGSALLIYNVLLEKVLMPPVSKLASAIKFN